jgi:predicted anti-sigma-YlaC factor YlaD
MMKYFDGEPNEAEELQFRQHLHSCCSCKDEFHQLEAIFTALGTKTELEPPDNFEAMVMDKVAIIEKEREERKARRIVWLYNSTILLSIALMLFFVVDMKHVNIVSAFEKIGEYFTSFSSVTAAVIGVVRDLFVLLGNALLVLVDVAVSIVKSYYYVFLALTLMIVLIQRALHYVGGTYARKEAK